MGKEIIADLHIHSRFSRACSSQLNIPNLVKWARVKGLELLGTGDFTHPEWLKVGKAVNSEERLNGYQTASPHRDYVLEYCEHFENRHEAESAIHRMLEKHKDCHGRKNEWFKTYIPTIKEVMNEYRDSLRHRDQQHPQYDMVLCN